jgi:phasin family protein
MDIGMTDAQTTAVTIQASMKDAAEQGYAKATAAFTTGIAEASAGLEKTQAQVKEHMEKAMKKAEEIASFNQGTVEALMKSSQIWSTGVQDLSKQLAATAQTQLDATLTTFKSMTSLRSLKDVMDLQASFARASMEKAMAETGKLTDATFKLAEETLAPLTARVGVAVETFSKAG